MKSLLLTLRVSIATTLIDYIEAMRLSSSFEDFVEFLKKIRYRGGIVSFGDRNHFVTDWREFNGEFVEDATGKIGLQDTRYCS